ncbi:MAG: hypothetical protein EBS11_27295 [Janthinobacterium sp.]|nr:hypothetical protein [Janthinobacterium sp.]
MRKGKELMTMQEARRLTELRLMLRVARESGMKDANDMFPHIAADHARWAAGVSPETMGQIKEPE